jgi:hypothetical protein
MGECKEPDHLAVIRLRAVELDDWLLLHQALRDTGDDGANDIDSSAEDVEEGGKDGLDHGGEKVERLMRSVPVTALVKELAARTVHSR